MTCDHVHSSEFVPSEPPFDFLVFDFWHLIWRFGLLCFGDAQWDKNPLVESPV